VIKSQACLRNEIPDILGEVAKQVIEKAESYDADRPFVPWVLGFVGYILATRQRKEAKARKQVPLSQLDSETNTAFWEKLTSHGKSKAEEIRRDLAEWLAELGEQDRRIIEARYFQNFDGRELAEAIGANSIGAARVRLCRALDRLRRIALREGGAE
jgi:RNA polymerase sigma factor (sigma-70 family)